MIDPAGQHFTYRIVQRDELINPLAYLGDPLFVQAKPVYHMFGQIYGIFYIRFVCLQDFIRFLFYRIGYDLQHSVLIERGKERGIRRVLLRKSASFLYGSHNNQPSSSYSAL